MPSPFGSKRSAGSYYQYGGVPKHYVANWDGMPSPSYRAATTRALGDYPVAMSTISGQRSILHSGPEQTRMHDGLGVFGLSRNESRLAMIAGVGLAGFIAWKMLKGKKRR